MAYQMGQDGKPLLSGEYLAAVGRGEIQDSRVAGFSPGAKTTLARNDQGQLVTNAMRIGGGLAARNQPMAPSAPAVQKSGISDGVLGYLGVKPQQYQQARGLIDLGVPSLSNADRLSHVSASSMAQRKAAGDAGLTFLNGDAIAPGSVGRNNYDTPGFRNGTAGGVQNTPAPAAPAPAPAALSGNSPGTHRAGTNQNGGQAGHWGNTYRDGSLDPKNSKPADAGNWGGVQNQPAGAQPGKLGDLNTMRQHWDQYWNNFAAGSKVPFAGGELTRNADGSATFKSASGQSYTYNKNTPFSELASRFPEIAAVWKQDFGYGVSPAPGTPPAPDRGGSPGFTSPGGPAPAAPSDQTQTEVTPEMSVEERAAAIAASDSPLMQQARGRAMQQMNERGLINSSIGIQAGQEAVLDKATDIAKADAQTSFQNSQNNANRAQQLQIAQLQAQTSLQNAQISASTQLQVAEINRQYSQMANLSSSTSSLMTAYNNDVNNIVLSDLSPEAKEAAINARTNTLRLSLNVVGSINGDVDMNTLLNQILG